MRYITTFDPTATKSGVVSIGTANPGDKVLMTNLTAVNIFLNFEDGTTDILHAGQANFWVLENITPQIEWSQKTVLPVVATPTQCDVVLYSANEKIEGTYPVSLIYFTIVANPNGVNTNVSGTATDLINDGQTLGHTYIESTPTGQASSSFTLANDGTMHLRTLVSGSYKEALQTTTGGNSPLIGDATIITEVRGALQADGNIHTLANLTVDGTVTITGVSTTAAINATTLSASGTLTVSGTATMNTVNLGSMTASGTLGVTGVSTLSTANVSTLNVSGNTALTGNLLFNNAAILQWKNVAGTAKNVMVGDASNNVVFTALDNDLFIFKDHGGAELLRITENLLDMTIGTTTEGIKTNAIQATGTCTLASVNATNISASGTLGVTGVSTLASVNATNISASGTLGVTGVSTLTGDTQMTTSTTTGQAQYTQNSTSAIKITLGGITTQSATVQGSGNCASFTGGITVSGSGGSAINMPNGGINMAVGTLTISGSGAAIVNVPSGGVTCSTLAVTSTSTFSGVLTANADIVLGSSAHVKLANGNTIAGISSFDGTTTGTYNHGYGSTPFFVIPMCSANGSMTMGYDTKTSTQVHITCGSGVLAFRCMCFG
jgi:hypothetical protein